MAHPFIVLSPAGSVALMRIVWGTFRLVWIQGSAEPGYITPQVQG